MFFEWWMVGVLFLVFFLGMRDMWRRGVVYGVHRGVESTLVSLHKDGYILYDGENIKPINFEKK